MCQPILTISGQKPCQNSGSKSFFSSFHLFLLIRFLAIRFCLLFLFYTCSHLCFPFSFSSFPFCVFSNFIIFRHRAKGDKKYTSAMPADVADKPVLCLCSDLGSSYSRCLPSLTNQWQIIFFVPHTAGNNCSGFSPDSFKEIT